MPKAQYKELLATRKFQFKKFQLIQKLVLQKFSISRCYFIIKGKRKDRNCARLKEIKGNRYNVHTRLHISLNKLVKKDIWESQRERRFYFSHYILQSLEKTRMHYFSN